jgi:hypothetical protein
MKAIVVFLAFASGCASVRVPPVIVRNFQIDSAFADMLAEYREILPTERVLCLYGVLRGDSAFLNYVRPATMRKRTRTDASYELCPLHPTPTAQYLGTWHNHKLPNSDASLCEFSQTDDHSFRVDANAVLELMSCKDKLMARSKYK